MREARSLVAGLDRQPRRIAVRAGDCTVEIEWPDTAESAGVAGHERIALAAPPSEAEQTDAFTVDSPLVGHFYRAVEPGAEPFVTPGQYVEQGEVVAIVEAMKLMNQITAPAAGRVIEVLPADGDVVEFGQRLIVFEPVEHAPMEIAS
nr:acetyl-CoA carboxylase biotin carboxyl carrier protein subunit [Nocardia bovistercoris]